MKIEYWMAGKTSQGFVKDGIEFYKKRIKTFLPLEICEINITATKGINNLKTEADYFLLRIKPGDHIILLDEKGKSITSREYAVYLEKILNRITSKLIFISGSAYGFHDSLKQRANGMISLSKMTFTHEMVRLFFLEQTYRAMAILNNHPYHND